MNKQIYLCVDLIARTQNHTFSIGENRKGMLTMVDDGDHFDFVESLPETRDRNPKIWQGQHLNVHKNKQGELVLNFRRTILTDGLDPAKYADEVCDELVQAKEELGV